MPISKRPPSDFRMPESSREVDDEFDPRKTNVEATPLPYRPRKKNRNGKKSSRRRRQFTHLTDFPKDLHGLPSNSHGGQRLSLMTGLKGGTYGPASPVRHIPIEDWDPAKK